MQEENSTDKVQFDVEKPKEPTGYILGTVKPGQDVIMGVIRYIVSPDGNLVRQSPKNSRRKMHKMIVQHRKASQNASLINRLEARDAAASEKMFKALEKKRMREDSLEEVVHPRQAIPHVKKILTPDEVNAANRASARARDIANAKRAAALEAKKKKARKQARLSRRKNRN